MPRGTASAWTPPAEVTARTIRIATRDDAAAIAAIYNPFIRDTTITFEETEVSADEIAARIADVAAASLPWYVAEDEGRIAGYAYATRWRARSAYRYAVEVTVYVDPAAARRGHGRRLYATLFDDLRRRGIHTALGCIALPNAASIALHESVGMHKVAQFEQVGFKFGRRIDTGYWQMLL